MLSNTAQSRRLKPMVAAALVAMAAASAQAQDGDLGALTPSLGSTFQVGFDFPSATFEDALSFTLDSAVTASFAAKGQGFTFPGVLTLAPASGLSFAVYKGGAALTPFATSFSALSLAAGTDYSFVVKGASGGYTVTWALSAVPEPQSLALLACGLALMGSVARRRSPQQG